MTNEFGTNPQRWEDVKVCTYAMCKNELKFLDKWIENVWNHGQGSDYITVLDTGSTDGTWERLQEIQNSNIIPEGHLIIGQKEIHPWRFDVARNSSMELIPREQIDACFCLDLDELVNPDFWTDFKKTVFKYPNFTTIYYNYAWRMKPDNTPDWYFWYDKTHGPFGWKWEYPVHETLTCSCPEKYSGKYYLPEDKIYVYHYPDPAKSRGSYFDLLKIRVAEHPRDITSNYYLARECSFKEDWEQMLQYSLTTVELMEEVDYLHQIPEEYAVLLTMVAKAYINLQKVEEAYPYLYKSIQLVPSCRPAYILLAQQLAYAGDSEQTYEVLNKMEAYAPCSLNTSWRIPGWYNSDWKKNQIIADAKSWEGKNTEALQIFDVALSQITDTDKRTATSQGFYADYNFVYNLVHEKKSDKNKAIVNKKIISQDTTENYSWVTLLYDNSYIDATIGLVMSLKSGVHTKYPISCIVSDTVCKENIHALTRLDVNIINGKNYISEEQQDYVEHNNVQWSGSLLKLQCYSLTQFDRVVYIDSDVMVAENMDNLFSIQEDSACIDLCGKGNKHCSGMMVITPNQDTYESLVSTANNQLKNPGQDLISDQTVFAEYFDWWNSTDTNVIPSEYNWRISLADKLSDDHSLIYSWHCTGIKPWNISDNMSEQINFYKQFENEFPKYTQQINEYINHLNECKKKLDSAGITRVKKLHNEPSPEIALSIVVPYHYEDVYKIYPLLYSIDNQSGVDFSKLEILICSNEDRDNSFDLSPFSNIKDRIRFIYKHYDISGPGQSRQLGLENAAGKYIAFYDYNDILFSGITLYEVACAINEEEKAHPNFSVLAFNYVDDVNGNLLYQQYELDKVIPYVQWCSVYNRQYLVDNHLGFNLNIALSEDIYFTLKLVCAGATYVKRNEYVYIHRTLSNSTGNTLLNTPNRLKDTFIIANDLMSEYHKEYGDLPQNLLTYTYLEACATVYQNTDGFKAFSEEDRRIVTDQLVSFLSKDNNFDYMKESMLPEDLQQIIVELYDKHTK